MNKAKKTFHFLFLSAFLCASLAACNQPSPEVSISQSAKDLTADFHFYSINDFHGSIIEQMNGNLYEGGMKKVFGKLHALKQQDPDHSFVLSAGDMWQGSLESNDNYGNLVTLAMNESFDAMTVGNHEFDYGVDRIFYNQELANFPILGGNIMKWENGKTTDKPWGHTDISTTIERGGIKLGIVGMIGTGQTSSITSKNVEDLVFVEPSTLAKNEATRLRQEENCDIVVLLMHNEEKSVQSWGNVKPYFDAVFNGHTHRAEKSLKNGVPFVQAACNGEYVTHVELCYDKGNVTCKTYEVLKASSNWPESEVSANLMEQYLNNDAFISKAGEVSCTLEGSLDKNTVATLGSRAIYEKYHKIHPNVIMAMENSQRANLGPGLITFRDIYKASPFTNNITILKATGADIIREASANHTYTGDPETYKTLNANDFYTIAVIDYLAYHQNSYKEYDYFRSLNSGNGGEILAEYEDYPNYITHEYLKTLEGTVNASDFSQNAPGFDIYR